MEDFPQLEIPTARELAIVNTRDKRVPLTKPLVDLLGECICGRTGFQCMRFVFSVITLIAVLLGLIPLLISGLFSTLFGLFLELSSF